MLFNSLEFAIFLPVVFMLYWFVFKGNLRLQNLLVVAASYLFYGWWDWRFLGLIIFSTCLDYLAGLRIASAETKKKRKFWLWLSILVNLGFLGVFKYFDFFMENFSQAFTLFGQSMDSYSLNIILPVGISFYTFQTMSYTLDVYRGSLKPTRNFVSFAAFVSFFPQLVAGPIERASHLLPQFYRKRNFDRQLATNGLQQILWGLFKKIVIADNCARFANLIFNNSGDYSGSTLVLGAILFAFQIYGDFSGYSDIAIGTARLFGFDLMRNFAYPYFSRDIAEFWRRWHISLSTWFRDYLYIPLGGSRGGLSMKIRNTFIIFIVSGFWHGANWTFIVWGALNAVYFLPLLLGKKNRTHLEVVAVDRKLPSGRELLAILGTFGLTVLAWIFFRAENLSHAWQYLTDIFTPSLFSVPYFTGISQSYSLLVLIVLFLGVEWMGRRRNFALEAVNSFNAKSWRLAGYYTVSLLILFYGHFGENQFIYFQF